MSKFGLFNDKTCVPFEAHLSKLEGDLKETLLELRSFVKSLGDTVIEDVRPHRVVYAKTLNFRIFLDVQPARDGLAIAIKRGRGEPEISHLISSNKDLEAVKSKISQAFLAIN
jgi:hypothetical protein